LPEKLVLSLQCEGLIILLYTKKKYCCRKRQCFYCWQKFTEKQTSNTRTFSKCRGVNIYKIQCHFFNHWNTLEDPINTDRVTHLWIGYIRTHHCKDLKRAVRFFIESARKIWSKMKSDTWKNNFWIKELFHNLQKFSYYC
jgi:hypothetical protein